jgi:hypothetical protein
MHGRMIELLEARDSAVGLDLMFLRHGETRNGDRMSEIGLGPWDSSATHSRARTLISHSFLYDLMTDLDDFVG